MKLLHIPNRPKILARKLQRIARRLRVENNARYLCVVTLNLDGTTDVWSHGYASLVERLGVLDLAKDALLHPPE